MTKNINIVNSNSNQFTGSLIYYVKLKKKLFLLCLKCFYIHFGNQCKYSFYKSLRFHFDMLLNK